MVLSRMAAAALRTSRKRSKSPAWRGSVFTQAGELGGVAERGERSVEEPHDVSDDDLGGRAAKLVAPLPSPAARHDPGVLEGQEDRLEELLGNPLALGDLAGRDDPRVPPLGEVDERLEGVEAALGDFQMYPYGS